MTPEVRIMLKEYTRRFVVCITGLAVFGLGNAFGVLAGSAGTNAWNTLSLGISGSLGISFGSASFVISLIIIFLDLLGKGKIGFGTILNTFLVSIFSDLWIGLFSGLPAPAGLLALLCTLLGQTVCSVATIIYMMPGLGCGPRDTLMVLVGNRFPRAPIGAVKFAIEVVALLCGILLGAPFGLGTVLVMVLQASIFQLCCRIFRFEPRALVHEDVLDTLRRVRPGRGFPQRG